MDWWREKNVTFSSRLILVLDCDNSLQWVRHIRKVEGLYVAVQGAALARAADVELQEPPQLGDFTSRWVEYNCNSNIQWSGRGGAVSADYGISKNWSDYTLHLPSGSDINNHWSVYYPSITYPVIYLALCLQPESGGPNPLKWFRRIKLNWFPPAVLDTGQGFKLLRS